MSNKRLKNLINELETELAITESIDNVYLTYNTTQEIVNHLEDLRDAATDFDAMQDALKAAGYTVLPPNKNCKQILVRCATMDQASKLENYVRAFVLPDYNSQQNDLFIN